MTDRAWAVPEVDDDERTRLVTDLLADHFEELMAQDDAAFRTKFRKMAASPFAFYRGTAVLFFEDVAAMDDPWATGDGRRVWIQADLHAENFGTYMDADGRLVFDVNDFDEAYLGHWTWDLLRFCASLALLCWQKALPDEVIDELVDTYLRAYLDQVDHYVDEPDDTAWALTLDNATGAVRETLLAARASTRVDTLARNTRVEDHVRRFRTGEGWRELDDDERAAVVEAFEAYVDTTPDRRRTPVTFDVLDVAGRHGFGIGSAGLPSYNVLIEGFTQALDNDVIVYLKQGNRSAVGRVVDDEQVREYFHHHGHRTALSQRALQARADRFTGWTELDGTGYVVMQLSPYEHDLAWDDVTDPDEMRELVEQLGRATAKVHCVADDDADEELVTGQVEDLIAEATAGRHDEFVADLTAFAHAYAERTRADHALFVDAFRHGAFDAVDPTG